MKTSTKIVIGMLATTVLVGGLAALTRGFTNWEPSTWLDQWKDDPDDSDIIEANGVKLQVQGGPMFAAEARAGDSKQITATITNADAMDKRIRWESSDPSKVSIAKSATESGEANNIELKDSSFAGSVTIYAYPELLGKDKGASVEVISNAGNEPRTVFLEGWIANLANGPMRYAREYDEVDMPETWQDWDGYYQLEGDVILGAYSAGSNGVGVYADMDSDVPYIGFNVDEAYLVFYFEGVDGCTELPADTANTIMEYGHISYDAFSADVEWASVSGNHGRAYVRVDDSFSGDPNRNGIYTFSLGNFHNSDPTCKFEFVEYQEA